MLRMLPLAIGATMFLLFAYGFGSMAHVMASLSLPH
jgi:hypothetical protein